jgi:hypothetical protein
MQAACNTFTDHRIVFHQQQAHRIISLLVKTGISYRARR